MRVARKFRTYLTSKSPDFGEADTLDACDEKTDTPVEAKREKPWGYERPICEFRGVFLKELFIRKGTISSLHFHEHKDELFYIVRGSIKVLLDETETLMGPGDTLRISPGRPHRIIPLEDSLILELGTRMFGDIFRLEDKYQRAKQE
jgi:mannose-6-phosphate isomerase-like protein (cupin superfamily)